MLTNNIALITGSLGGISFATAKALAKLGCGITLNGSRNGKYQSPSRRTEDLAAGARYRPTGPSHPEQMAELIVTTQQDNSGIDILVNNAVVRHSGAVETFTSNTKTKPWQSTTSLRSTRSGSHCPA